MLKWNRNAAIAALALGLAAVAGCGGGAQTKEQFFTSGSREADQRAEQRIAKTDQLQGKGASGDAMQGVKKSLYERLGGDAGIKAVVDDFVARALADPRVNWERKGISKGGFLGMGTKAATWDASPPKVERLKLHMQQFMAVATGGPAKYGGGEMRQVHKGMKIDNAEFDAAVGDLQASLNKLHVGTDEQKELLAIVESTRPQVVEQR